MKVTAETLYQDEIISEKSYQKVKFSEENPLFSVFWELRTLLYIGVLLFTGGLGVLIYQNIGTIGHQAILAFIVLCSAGCFFYCFKHATPFSTDKIKQQQPFLDYVLLTGCLLFLTFEGYIQYQYNAFGTRYGLAAIIPAVSFFFLAYRFDNISILSMAITALSAWAGISVTPLHLLESNDFTGTGIIFTGEVLGIALAFAGWLFAQKNFKEHFFYTYINFASHLLFVSTLAGLFMANSIERLFWFMWLIVLAGASTFFAKKEKSFYFLLIALIYSYTGLTYIFFKSIDWDNDSIVWLGMWYFIVSCAAIIYFLVHHKKIISGIFGTTSLMDNKHDHL